MLIQKLSDSATIQHRYLYDYIIETLGWFSHDLPEKGLFKMTFSGKVGDRFQLLSENSYRILWSEKTVRTFENRLFGNNTDSPDHEPPPFEFPDLDVLLQSYQQDIVTFCQKNRIPFLYKMPWPSGHPFALVLTHDVDLTRKYGFKILAKDLLTAHFKKFGQHFALSAYRDNIYWNFDDLLDFYSEKKIRSSFFFIAREWENFSYRYNIKTPKFQRLFEKIMQEDHEIGLHSSRYAFDYPARISTEKQKLEKMIGRKIAGIRQHYLRLQFPEAWRYFHDAGIHYDSSCGYNSTMGFRAGTSLPFKTFDVKRQEILEFYEIPFTVMDYPWWEGAIHHEGRQKNFMKIVNHIEENQGLLHILWHPHNLVEDQFKPLWDSLFCWIDQKMFYQDSLTELLRWWKTRAAVSLKSLRTDSGAFEFVLESAQPVKYLSLRLISPQPLASNSQLNLVQPDNHYLYQLTIKHLKPGIEKFRFSFA